MQHGGQAFLTLRYQQPALRAVEPSRTRLVIAPIDAVYSQAVLLHVTAFLDAAWPPAALDPLTVRTTVTLREIVTERLVGPRRPHQLQKHQHSQQQVQVCLLTVELLFGLTKGSRLLTSLHSWACGTVANRKIASCPWPSRVCVPTPLHEFRLT